jgi:hypothetical protein
MKKLLILLTLFVLSCKKAEVKPIEPTQTIQQNEPVKTPKLLNVNGKWQTIVITINRNNVTPPVNVYKGDTLNIKAYHNTNNPLVEVYFDGVYFDSFTSQREITKTYIIE